MNGRRVRFHLSVGILAAAIVAGVGGGGGGLASMLGGRQALAASEDPREVKGRALFAQGEYQSALELFAALYAENRDPIYLRPPCSPTRPDGVRATRRCGRSAGRRAACCRR